MSFTLDGTTLLVLGVLAVVVAVLVALWIVRRRKTQHLRRAFGPEYERQVSTTGNRTRAEDDLEARRRRVSKYELRELTLADRENFALRWRQLQRGFIDRPSEAVEEAARLLTEAMERRGYPMGEIQRPEEDLSVHYPREVQDYRRAHEIAGRNRRGEATTEELREAILHYRKLFAHLVGTDDFAQTERAR